MAVAGVKKKDPATMVAMKGSPKRRNGCLFRAERYFAAMVLDWLVERNFLFGKTAIEWIIFEKNCSTS